MSLLCIKTDNDGSVLPIVVAAGVAAIGCSLYRISRRNDSVTNAVDSIPVPSEVQGGQAAPITRNNLLLEPNNGEILYNSKGNIKFRVPDMEEFYMRYYDFLTDFDLKFEEIKTAEGLVTLLPSNHEDV